MKTIRQTIATLLIAVCATGAMAQTATSSYFLEGAFHNYKLNPAMQPERAYFSLGAGNISLRLNGNVGISNFLFPNGDNLTTFMSSNVSSDEFLNALPDNARIGFNYEQDIFDFGFRMLGGYTSFGMSLHSSMSMLMPKGLFKFAKMGLQNENYNFAGLNLNTMNYAAITLGHSREIIKGLNVGLNLKYLAGIGYANLSVDKLNVELNDKHWMINSHASAQAAFLCQAEPMYNEDGAVNGVDFMPKSSSSSGFAADLGVVYNMNHFVPGLTVSASVTNIGAIKWNNMMNVEKIKNGFTLIELIATIALLAIIAIISFVSINGVVNQSKVNNCESLMMNIKTAAKEYVSDNRYNFNNNNSFKIKLIIFLF